MQLMSYVPYSILSLSLENHASFNHHHTLQHTVYCKPLEAAKQHITTKNKQQLDISKNLQLTRNCM